MYIQFPTRPPTSFLPSPSVIITCLPHYRRCHSATKTTSVDILWAFKGTCDGDDTLTGPILAVKHQSLSYTSVAIWTVFSRVKSFVLHSCLAKWKRQSPWEWREWCVFMCSVLIYHWNSDMHWHLGYKTHLRPCITALTMVKSWLAAFMKRRQQ